MWQEGVDKLVDVIQILQLHRETGQLTVIRGDGMTAEDGIIVFANGKVVEARVGRRTGSDALNKLSNWENCLCQFIHSKGKSIGPDPSILNQASKKFNTGPANAPPPSYSSAPRIEPREEKASVQRSNILPVSVIPLHIVELQVAFHKIDQLGLSRPHRHLFLLIDGQRSISDLIQLTGKEDEIVYTLLLDLERAVLIKFIDLTKSPASKW